MILMQQRLPLSVQLDGFGSDSVRLVRDLRRDAQQPVQFLLFSATFNERIKSYALRVTADYGKEEVNQVWPCSTRALWRSLCPRHLHHLASLIHGHR